MLDLCRLIRGVVVDLFRSRAALETELLVLRQQINAATGFAEKAAFWPDRQTDIARCLHGERLVAVGTLDMAIWDVVAKIEGKPLT